MVYPVIRVARPRDACDQALIALDMGAAGVYLSDPDATEPTALFGAFDRIAARAPRAFVGLGLAAFASAYEGLREIRRGVAGGLLPRLPDGIWAPDAMPAKSELRKYRKKHPDLLAIRYLGGIAYKETDGFTSDVPRAVESASSLAAYVDVVATSGDAAGVAPSPAKVAAMKLAIDGKPLAVASGITPENISDYRGSADEFLVTTSIETHPRSGVFDRERLAALLAAAAGIAS
jgi:hypothetical protein